MLCENLNLKIEELGEDMAKEISALDNNYSSLHKKVDIIADTITKVLEWYNSLLSNVEKMAEDEVKSFGNIDKVLTELKGLVLKSGFVSSLLISPKLLSEKFKLLELTIQKELAQLTKLINLMPTSALPVHTGVKAEEKGGVGIGTKIVDVSKLQVMNKEDFLIGFAHLKVFIDGYYGSLALTGFELALTLGKHVTVPQSMLKSQATLKNFEDGEICLKPLGIVFIRKNKKGNNTKFLFQVCDVERYTMPHYTNLMV
ncbi:unnamed protein product [Lactuca saligna]|uniref:Uncharacterized protein n=1 Tax=Lactuca saligna TaxID=75948 RepID=A0AA36EL79_LACSI|nr:unnamed protein product [Lactuca saligna]